jgi:protocatechuate 3,4-dioxygenase beta subunit
MTMIWTRRRVLGATAALPFVSLAYGQTAPLTLSCAEQTPRQTEGPFFKTDSPKRASLVESASRAPRFVVTGRVLSRECRPVANALLDFWHSDEEGAYDNRGFRYRGHQFSDSEGRYRLETIVPAEYPGRTRHIHVKVQAPGKRILTTQLYFPGEPGNRRDGLYRRELEMRVPKTGEGAFDFVVEA